MSISYDDFDVALHRLRLITEALGTTLGVRIDVGGESIFVVDNTGRSTTGIELCAVMAELVLTANPGKSIAVSVKLPKIFEEIAGRHQGKVIRAKADPHALMIASLEADVVMAADGEGNFIFPAFQPSVDGLMAITET
jgi:mannose-1-phosphate guanylyltransferase/phosphomannomutase